MAVKESDYAKTISSKEYQKIVNKLDFERQEALEAAIKRGRIDIIVSFINSPEPKLRIRGKSFYNHVYLATVMPIDQIQLGVLSDIQEDKPLDMVIFEDEMAETKRERFLQIASALPAFLAQLDPRTQNLPIHLFSNPRRLALREPVLKVHLGQDGIDYEVNERLV